MHRALDTQAPGGTPTATADLRIPACNDYALMQNYPITQFSRGMHAEGRPGNSETGLTGRGVQNKRFASACRKWAKCALACSGIARF